MRLLFGAIAADLHLAPASLLVLGRIEEEPAAMVAGALLDARHVALHQQRQGREGDRPKDRLDETVGGAPRPHEVSLEGRELGARDASGVNASERVGIGRRWRLAMRDRAADAIDDFTQFDGAPEQPAAEFGAV